MTPHCSLTKRRRRREPEGLFFLGAPAAATKGGASARLSSPFPLAPPRLDGNVARQGPPNPSRPPSPSPQPTAQTQCRCQPSPPCRKDKGRGGKGREDGSGGGGGEGCGGVVSCAWWSERIGSPPNTETAAEGQEGPQPALSVARQKTRC